MKYNSECSSAGAAVENRMMWEVRPSGWINICFLS